jgi:hypothetical protein
MSRLTRFVALLVVLSLRTPGVVGAASDEEVEQLKNQVKQLMQRVDQLEKERAAPTRAETAPPPVAAPPPAAAPAKEIVGAPSEVDNRSTLRDDQEAAPRPGDLTLDPKYRGFIPVPNTPVIIKFNAKPRADLTLDSQNSGDDNRFVTAEIPVEGNPAHGGSDVFNINAKGSQLRLDVRAPSISGSPRFYYENDFFGSGGGEFPYRVRHLYGQIYNIIVGQTFSVFEDPDVWPDTVDYEGPNAAVFARRPLARYQHEFGKYWQLNLGLEQPGSEVDTTSQPDASSVNHAPDGGFNVRWERSGIGHVQFASIFRDIGVKSSSKGEQSVLGWGTNLSTVLDGPGGDSGQAQLTYGEGLFRYSNDDFVNNDAAFDRKGNLEAIPYFGGMAGYTHRWTDELRSTVSYGYVHLDNTSQQEPTAYHLTHYASGNLIWQIRKRLSVGTEVLYGYKETKDGSHGDVIRFQVGLLYSIFD